MDTFTIAKLVGGALLAVLLGAVLLVLYRREVREQQRPWSGRVLRFEFSRGLLSTDGTTRIRYNTNTMYVSVYYQRDDGVLGVFHVADREPFLSTDPPNLYREIMKIWREGDRIEKPAGDRPPHRIGPGNPAAT